MNKDPNTMTDPELRAWLGKKLHLTHIKSNACSEDGWDCSRCRTPDYKWKTVPYCPIPLTWPEAMKRRDWAVAEYDACEYHDALLAVFMYEMDYVNDDFPPTSEFVHWLATKAQPRDYLIAAAKCKENSNGK